MSDPLNIGVSALTSLQRSISTTGQNIANVNTEGYSRQRVNLIALPAQLTGAGFVGSGVSIGGIERSYDAFLAADVRLRNSNAGAAESIADFAGRLDSVLADPNTGLAPAIETFFAAVQDVANNPGSLPERQVLLREGEVLADRFAYLSDTFVQVETQISANVRDTVRDINSLVSNIAALNEQIVTDTNRAGGAPPNDLLDQRDLLLDRLSNLVGISTVEQDDGGINVFIGNGQSLVVGNNASQLETFQDPLEARRLGIALSGAGSQQDISDFLSGGTLGAAIQARTDVVGNGQAQLGVIAAGIADAINSQNSLGLDLDGNLGTNFFAPVQPLVAARSDNTGAGVVTATVTNPAQLSGDDFSLRFDDTGNQYVLRNLSTDVTYTFAEAVPPQLIPPTPVAPTDLDLGFQITVSTLPDDGDEFLISPVASAISDFRVQITDPRAFAAASPVRLGTSLGNVGNGRIEDLSVSAIGDLSNPASAPASVTLQYDAADGEFDVLIGAAVVGVIAYDAADAATVSNGVEVTSADLIAIDPRLTGLNFTLAGRVENGDSFTISQNADGSGDNRNALAMAGFQTTPLLNEGNASFQDAYASLVADVAIESRQALSTAETENALREQAIATRDSLRGVNLDEEAANLLRFQQAYQAAAQVIAVADEVFQVLLNAATR